MMTTTGPSHPPIYTKYFEFFRVEREDLLNTAFHIRYQVYCEERGFLDPGQYPRQIETDPYDGGSVHFVGRHRIRCLAAGTVRLVLPSHQGFPLQGHCEFDRNFAFIQEAGHPALRQYAEISRLAVSKTFRQRTDDTVYGGPPRPANPADPLLRPAEPGMNPLEAGPEIVAGLFKSMYHETKRRGLTHVLVAMERSLHLLLRRMGYHFRPIGPVVDYYGLVIPYIAKIADLERGFYANRRAVFDYWMEGLEPQYRPRMSVTTPPRIADAAAGEGRRANGKR